MLYSEFMLVFGLILGLAELTYETACNLNAMCREQSCHIWQLAVEARYKRRGRQATEDSHVHIAGLHDMCSDVLRMLADAQQGAPTARSAGLGHHEALVHRRLDILRQQERITSLQRELECSVSSFEHQQELAAATNAAQEKLRLDLCAARREIQRALPSTVCAVPQVNTMVQRQPALRYPLAHPPAQMPPPPTATRSRAIAPAPEQLAAASVAVNTTL